MKSNLTKDRDFGIVAVLLIVSWLSPNLLTANDVTILVNPGPFELQVAATSEERVDWWDEDTTDDDACTESYAAAELRHFLISTTKFSVKSIAISSQQTLPETGYIFVLGTRNSNSLIKELDPDGKFAAPAAPESFRWRVETDHNRTVCVIEGRDRVGTLYGVYSFLESLGIRFYGLGEFGTVLPIVPVALPYSGGAAESPSFYSRGFWAFEDRGSSEFFQWMARNRLNYWTASGKQHHLFKKLGLNLTVGGHDIQFRFLNPNSEYPYNHPLADFDNNKLADPYAPPESDEFKGDANGDGVLSYFESHPEWYGLYQGKRRDNITITVGTNFCTSNSAAVKELSRNLVRALIDGEEFKHADIVNLWMLDNGKWCQCEQCKRQGSLSDRLVAIVHQVRQECLANKDLKRDVQIASLAYHETLEAPSKPLPKGFDYNSCYFTYFPIERTYTHTLNDPASSEINAPLCRDLQGWLKGDNRHYKGDLCVGEYYNVSRIKSLPVLFPSTMAVDIPWYHAVGTRHFQYMHVPTRSWGTWTLNHALMSRLIWNHEADSESILDEYFTKYYPETQATTRSSYTHLERATANIKELMHYVGQQRYSLRGQLLLDKKKLFISELLPYDSHGENDDPSARVSLTESIAEFELARNALDESLKQISSPAEKARLLEDSARLKYGEAMYRFYFHIANVSNFHHADDVENARKEFVLVKEQGDFLKTVTDLVRGAGTHGSAENGFQASQIEKVYLKLEKLYGN